MSLMLLLSLLAGSSAAATITAQLDRDVIYANESFQLVYEAAGSVDADPDFAPLTEHFDILNQSKSSNVSIINGSYKKNTKWTLALMPKQSGSFTIPPVTFGKDSGPSLALTVKPAASSGAAGREGVFIELESSSDKTWVQGQLVVTVRLLSDQNISRYGFGELSAQGMDIVVEQLGDEKQYKAYRAGKAFLVIERRYAVFPQQSGELKIGPVLAEAEVVSANNSYLDPFRRNSQVKRVRSETLGISVAGVPGDYQAPTWLPAADLKLVEHWPQDPPEFKVGEPVTRTLSLLADGLTAAQLPKFSNPQVDGLKQYPDQPSLRDNKSSDGIIGLREEKVALIPVRAGRYTLPAIEVAWWNTVSGKAETARIAARTITVVANAGVQNGEPVQPTLPAAPAPQDPAPVPETASADSQDGQVPVYWIGLSLLLALGWLGTLLAWWLSRRRNKVTTQIDHAGDYMASVKKAEKALRRACDTNDAYRCKQALLDWGKALFPECPPRSLGALAEMAEQPLQDRLNELSAALYSADNNSWSAAGIWENRRGFRRGLLERTAPAGESLVPLHLSP